MGTEQPAGFAPRVGSRILLGEVVNQPDLAHLLRRFHDPATIDESADGHAACYRSDHRHLHVPSSRGGSELTSWPEGERFLAEIGADARRKLLALLESPDEVRAHAIGRLHVRDDGADLEELLILLEEKEWARQWFIVRLHQVPMGFSS
jgi:hypothetical protein